MCRWYKMNATLAVRKKDSKESLTKVRTLSIWASSFLASFTIAKRQNLAPLSLRETIRVLKDSQKVEHLLREDRGELEAYLEKNPEMNVTRKEGWRMHFSKLHTLWTSTMAAYPGSEPLGKVIRSSDCAMGSYFRYSFPVPKRFRGMKDVLLLFEFPDYTLNKKINSSGGLDISIEVNPRKVQLVEEFPAWGMNNVNLFALHPVFGIPYGKPLCPRGTEQKPEGATKLERWPKAFIAPATVWFPPGTISVEEPMSRNYCRMLVRENIDDSHA